MSHLVENHQLLAFRRTAELFGEMWQEQLLKKARVLYMGFMRVRKRVVHAFLSGEWPEIGEHNFVSETRMASQFLEASS